MKLFALEAELEETKAEAYSLASPAMSGMPHGGDVSNSVANAADRIEAVLHQIEEEQANKLVCFRELMELISAEKPERFEAFKLRYVNNMKWEHIAITTHYDQNTLRHWNMELCAKANAHTNTHTDVV